MMQHPVLEREAEIRFGVGAFVIATMLLTGMSWAQDVTSENPAAAAAQSTATEYPTGLDDPSIDLEPLQLRLIPLTADQLAPLAAAWMEHARDATQAAIDKRLEIRAAEGSAAEALREERLALLEERNLVFEKFSTVISSLEGKGGDPAEVAARLGWGRSCRH